MIGVKEIHDVQVEILLQPDNIAIRSVEDLSEHQILIILYILSNIL